MEDFDIEEKVKFIQKYIPEWTVEKEEKYIQENLSSDSIRDYIENAHPNDIKLILDHIDINDIVEHYGGRELAGHIDTFDILRTHEIEDLIDDCSESYESIISYILDNRYVNFDEISKMIKKEYYEDIIDSEEAKDLIIKICRQVSPRGYLDKVRIKEILNDIVDFNFWC